MGTAAEQLLDIELVRQLKYRYFRFIDTKDWAGITSCFLPDATATYPRHVCASRDEILAFLSRSMTPDLVTMHHGHHPEITIDGDTAVGVWHLHDKVLYPAFNYSLEGAALYTDRYVRVDGEWLIAHTGYERIFEATWSTEELPSFKVVQGQVSRGEDQAEDQAQSQDQSQDQAQTKDQAQA